MKQIQLPKVFGFSTKIAYETSNKRVQNVKLFNRELMACDLQNGICVFYFKYLATTRPPSVISLPAFYSCMCISRVFLNQLSVSVSISLLEFRIIVYFSGNNNVFIPLQKYRKHSRLHNHSERHLRVFSCVSPSIVFLCELRFLYFVCSSIHCGVNSSSRTQHTTT